MDLMGLRDYALALPGVTEDCPFGEGALVFRVGGKIFVFMSLYGGPIQVSMKCDPELARHLREQYPQITPGYHLNKKHWITLGELKTLPEGLVQRQVRHSYRCVLKKLPKAVRKGLGELPLDDE